MNSMNIFNHWRGKDRIPIFAPRSVADVKLGKQKRIRIAAAGSSSSCASCGSGCSGGGCSGIGCGV